MLDPLFAILITAWLVFLLWQVVRGSVSRRTLARLSGNPKLTKGYLRAAKTLMLGSVGLLLPAAIVLALFLEDAPGITLWDVWTFAALVADGVLLSRRLTQAAVAADKSRGFGQVRDR